VLPNKILPALILVGRGSMRASTGKIHIKDLMISLSRLAGEG